MFSHSLDIARLSCAHSWNIALTLEDKIRIYARACNILYMYHAYTSTQVLPLLLSSEQVSQSCPYHICNCWFRDKDNGLERWRKTSSGDLCPVSSRLYMCFLLHNKVSGFKSSAGGRRASLLAFVMIVWKGFLLYLPNVQPQSDSGSSGLHLIDPDL